MDCPGIYADIYAAMNSELLNPKGMRMASPHPSIGFITVESSTSYTTQLLLGANDAAMQLGCSLVTFGINEQTLQAKVGSAQFYKKLEKLIDPATLDGLLIWTAGLLQDHAQVGELLTPYTARPTVSLGIDQPGTYRVVMDGYRGMFDLVSHLIATCNRSNPAFITGTPTNTDAQIRLAAYRDALHYYGLPIREEAIVPGAFRWDSRALGAQAVGELFDVRHLHPDAIVAASDDLAIGAMEELQRRGIAVPATISVTGFDDLPEAGSVYPALTTVAQPAYQLAWRGVDFLLRLINGEQVPECIKIPTAPVIRHSCGTVRRWPQQQGRTGAATATPQAAAAGTALMQPLPLEAYLVQAGSRYRTIIESALVAQGSGTLTAVTQRMITQLLTSFERSLLTEESGHLQNTAEALFQGIQQEQALVGWHAGLLALIQQFCADCTTVLPQTPALQLPSGQQQRLCYLSQLLEAQLAFLFEVARNRVVRDREMREKQQFALLHMVSRSLLIQYDPQRLRAIFQEKLPQMGIDLAYVAIHEAFDATAQQVRLLIGYEEDAQQPMLPTNTLYAAADLASGALIRQGRRLNLVLIPLYSTNIYAGFVIFGFGPRSYQFYTQLASMVGYSLISNFLLDEMRKYASQLESHVSERTAAIQQTNQLLQREIAERKRIETQLESAYEQAVRSSRLKSEFLATMSHEIRTPMNGVMGMAELLMESNLDAEQATYATVAYEESQKLLAIINSILDFSKIEAGKITLETEPFAPTEELDSIIRLLTPKAQSKGIALVSAVTANVPKELIGDATRLRQILMNLMGNAVKFTERGEVAVTLTCLPHPVNGPATARHERGTAMRSLQITVRDTGIGMSVEHRKNLFQVFMQADSSTTRRYGGTGLGLAITQRLVDLLGGQIVVESELGVGSKFTVTIPYQCSATEDDPSSQNTITRSIGACLFVSNNRALYQEVAGYLATWSIQTEEYAQSASGNARLLFYLRQVAATGSALPVIIIDQQSVAIEPVTLVRSVRADPLLGQAVLMLIAPKLLPPLHQQLLADGFDGVTTLPVTQSAIYNLLTALIQQEAESSVQADLAQPTAADIAQAVTTAEKQHLVLVAEDYVNNQRVALAYLKKLGYAAHVVENGAAAVDAIINSGDRYQAVLMDWQMPIMDGLEATRKIRAWEIVHGQHTPIIGMTANAIKGARESCLAAGMDDYLSKPVKREELQALLTAWVPVA